MKARVALSAVAALLLLAAAAEKTVSAAGIELAKRLTADMPTDELAPVGEETPIEAARAAELLEPDSEGAACSRACDEASTLLDGLCERVVQPAAARSRAICYVRAVELVARCEARCAGD